MEKINTIESKAIIIAEENIDTDQIIPARFLKATNREGFGDNLFADWRYHKDGTQKEGFPLNQAKGDEQFLIAGKNFGCGSSREHAAWSIYDFGFRVVISSFFADIFRNNALNNGIVPVQVTNKEFEELLNILDLSPNKKLLLNLEEQSLCLEKTNFKVNFDINPYKKECLLNAYDDIDYLLREIPVIEKYEQEINLVLQEN